MQRLQQHKSYLAGLPQGLFTNTATLWNESWHNPEVSAIRRSIQMKNKSVSQLWKAALKTYLSNTLVLRKQTRQMKRWGDGADQNQKLFAKKKLIYLNQDLLQENSNATETFSGRLLTSVHPSRVALQGAGTSKPSLQNLRAYSKNFTCDKILPIINKEGEECPYFGLAEKGSSKRKIK